MFFMAKKREKMGKEKNIVRAPSCRGWLHAPHHHEEGGETHQIPPRNIVFGYQNGAASIV